MSRHFNRSKFHFGCTMTLVVLLSQFNGLSNASDETKISLPFLQKNAGENHLKEKKNSITTEGNTTLDALPEVPGAVVTPWESNLWTRLVDGFSIPDLEGELVERYERNYSNHPEVVKNLIEHARPYLYYIANEVERRGLPMEVALLPMIESAFNPYAYSRSHASGLWQIIPSTGKHLGLSQSREHDERMDVMEATRSALDYLEYLHTMFPDWQLALAAYNWGEGSLSRSVSRSQNKGLLVDYWNVDMPKETRHYVPKLQALKNIIRHPEQFGIEIPIIPDRPYFRSVAIDKPMVVKHVARLADISVNEFSSLNPGFKKPVINGSSENKYRLLIPVEKAATFEKGIKANASSILALSAENKGSENASDNPLSKKELQFELNNQDSPTSGVKGLVRAGAGQTVSGPVDEDVVKPELQMSDQADEGDEDDSSTIRWISYRVKRGDTLRSIANHFDLNEADILRWNHANSHETLSKKRILRLRIVDKRAHIKRSSHHHVIGKSSIRKKPRR